MKNILLTLMVFGSFGAFAESKILKSTLDKMNQINFQSSLPHCLDQTPTSQVEWEKLWDDDGQPIPIAERVHKKYEEINNKIK